MKRGEVWTVSGGLDYAGKPRPAVILQNDDYSKVIESVTICMFTTKALEDTNLRPLIRPGGSKGIKDQSYLMVDKISTVPAAKIKDRIGALGEEDMAVLNRAAIEFLGLTDSPD